jgi:Trp operon repressor
MNTNTWCEKEIDELISLVAETTTVSGVESLFEVILTPREINDMAKRLKIRKLLETGKTYSEIQQQLHVSPTIIGRVSNKIGYGFRRSYSNIGQGDSTNKTKKRAQPLRYKGATPITHW